MNNQQLNILNWSLSWERASRAWAWPARVSWGCHSALEAIRLKKNTKRNNSHASLFHN